MALTCWNAFPSKHEWNNLALYCCDRKVWACAKLHIVAAGNNRDHPTRSLLLLVHATYIYGCYSLRTSRSWWIAHSMQCQPRGWNNIPSCLQWTTPIARSFCEGCTWHELHILDTKPFCCNRKSLSSKCVKLHTVAASSNRYHMPQSLFTYASCYIQSFTC